MGGGDLVGLESKVARGRVLEEKKKLEIEVESEKCWEPLIDIKDAAAIFKLKVSYLRGLVFRNEIPFYKIGALVRFDRQEVDAWMRSKRIPVGGAQSVNCGKPKLEFFEIDTRFNKASSGKEEV